MRRSISQTGIDQPGGPSSHCLTSSGLVRASKTRRRGASNTRVITISRSPEAVSFRFPVFFMVVSPLSLAASTLLFRLLLLEQGVETLEVALPEPAVFLQPPGGLH